ncbi:MAG: DEAD/DEAH box helicase [Phycisphaerae bacterium]|nr:DEAD/DEAH box helicase [Phycisphaerae bacterium]
MRATLLPTPKAPPLTLRPYQAEAVDAVYRYLRDRDDNPVVVIPTAGGKTPVMSTICRDAVQKWSGRVLILAHVKELLEQTADTLRRVAPDLEIGVYSAGLKSRDTDHPIIVASIQSVYKRACELDAFDLVLVDESHLIPLDGEGMYRQFLADAKTINPNIRVVGLTATPYRLKGGMIAKEDHFLNTVCYEIGVKELIVQGFLCPLKTKAGKIKANLDNLHVRGGEFVANEVEAAMDNIVLVQSACEEIVELTQERNSCLLFTSGVAHGQHIARTIQRLAGQDCGFVCGETPGLERESILRRFKAGELKYLANVNVLTTGFDAPNIDCVTIVRPTMSPGLMYQMVGRGFRLHPDKTDCLVLDYGGNILRHGPVDDLKIKEPGSAAGEAPAKECPKCQALIHAAYATCPECDYEFPPPEKEKHESKASNAGILSGQITDTQYDVYETTYCVHAKRGAAADHPRTMRVNYRVAKNDVFGDWKSEWACPEHSGYARNKFVAWWKARSNEPPPNSAEQAVELADAGALAETRQITVRTVAGEKYDSVVNYKLGDKPPRLDGSEERDSNQPGNPHAWIDDDEIPF